MPVVELCQATPRNPPDCPRSLNLLRSICVHQRASAAIINLTAQGRRPWYFVRTAAGAFGQTLTVTPYIRVGDRTGSPTSNRSKPLCRGTHTSHRNVRLICPMAGHPCLHWGAGGKDVDGRDERGHDTNDTWDRRGHDTWGRDERGHDTNDTWDRRGHDTRGRDERGHDTNDTWDRRGHDTWGRDERGHDTNDTWGACVRNGPESRDEPRRRCAGE